ncbi:hypothetical protein BAZMOX_32210_3 [methanotrophic endosymbiont of Bathymodiolus azoricus (Menez Gwen)]|jgi:ribosome modulation factor|nr:hypothetical protein BAZMOX_32210_3 [methanotrophic endosymbiont of Bathymodiolus azoricus (Menez Gwen)]
MIEFIDIEYQSNAGTKIEAEGYKAGCVKKSSNENPYEKSSWQYDIWEQGRVCSYAFVKR